MKSLKNRATDRMLSFAERFAPSLVRLASDQRGVSAVEFALLLPLMLTLYLGTIEISQGIAAGRKVTLTARTVADLVSQASKLSSADMTNSLNAASAVMAPFPATNLATTVTSVKIDANGNATVDWSVTQNGTAKTPGQTVTLPTALKVPSTWLIWSEVQYVYTPSIGYVLSGSLTLTDQIYMRPRLSDSVTYPAT